MRARIFISYKSGNIEFATKVADELRRYGHMPLYCGDEIQLGTSWRNELTRQLISADILLPLMTSKAWKSPYILGEIGAARALAELPHSMKMLPVLIGDQPDQPHLIGDLTYLIVRNTSAKSAEAIARKVDLALQHYDRQRQRTRLFISHAHADRRIAKALVQLLEAAFRFDRSEVRCTSLRPYKLPVGARSGDSLCAELSTSHAVFGLLTPQSVTSSYVQFELGAAWAHGIRTCPLLRSAADAHLIPAPIADLSPLTLDDPDDCHGLLEDIDQMELFESRAREQHVDSAITHLVKVAGEPD